MSRQHRLLMPRPHYSSSEIHGIINLLSALMPESCGISFYPCQCQYRAGNTVEAENGDGNGFPRLGSGLVLTVVAIGGVFLHCAAKRSAKYACQNRGFTTDVGLVSKVVAGQRGKNFSLLFLRLRHPLTF